MGFVVKVPETIDLAVRVAVPGAGKQTFSVKAKYLTMKERKAFMEEISEDNLLDLDVAKKIIVGWSGVREESGEDIPFNVSSLERLMDIPYCHAALMDAVIAEYLNLMPRALQPYAQKN